MAGILSIRPKIWIGVLALASTIPIVTVPYPPLYDYYLWAYQGHIVSSFFAGGSAAAAAADAGYHLSWVPVPNLASAVGIGVLGTFLSHPLAARVFLVLCMLAFAGAFACLVRTVQRRATAVELLGFPWAYGYFMYRGYESYILGLAIGLFALAKLHRMVERRDSRTRDLVGLAALAILAFLAHLFGWALLAVGAVSGSVRLAREGKKKDAAALASAVLGLPMLLFVIFAARSEELELLTYDGLADKAISLVSPLLLFLRTDPLPPPFSILWANVVGWLLLAGVIVWNLDRSTPRLAREPLVWSGLLAAVALLNPFVTVGDLGRPDERLVLPAFLLFFFALPFKPATALRNAVAAGVVLLVLGAHAVEYDRASDRLERIERATEAAIPDGSSVLSITVWESRAEGSYDQTSYRSMGTPALKWFGLQRLLSQSPVDAVFRQTSLVRSSEDKEGVHRFRAIVRNRRQLGSSFAYRPPIAKGYDFVEVFGSRRDLLLVEKGLAPDYEVVSGEESFIVLARRDANREPPRP